MREIASAFCLAFVVGGCGTQWWQLIPIDASVGPDGDAGRPDANNDAPGGDAQVPYGRCNSDADCVQFGWPCYTRIRWCVECIDDTDCKLPGYSHCDNRNTCVQCLPQPVDTCGPGMRCDVAQCFYSCADGGGCPPTAPLCNTSDDRFVCAICLTNDDCADAAVPSFCDPGTGQCMENDQIGVRPPGPDASSLDSGDASSDASSDAVPDTGSVTDATDDLE